MDGREAVSEWLVDELRTGIANLKETLAETPSDDTFWTRYWAGYLKAYEGLLEKATAQEKAR